jgi:hypothetical protein
MSVQMKIRGKRLRAGVFGNKKKTRPRKAGFEEKSDLGWAV